MTVYYDPKTPILKSVLDWRYFKKTCFFNVLQALEFWAFLIFHSVLVILTSTKAIEVESIGGEIPPSAAVLVQFFMTFFLTFYNKHCFVRYRQLYDECMNIIDGALLFVTELTVSFNHPELQQHRNLATKYLLATVYIYFITLTGGKLEPKEWKELTKKGLLTKAETEALAVYPGGEVTLVLTVWVMVVVDDALEQDCLWQPHSQRIAHLHNRLNDAMVIMTSACHSVSHIIAMPIPFPYYHLMNLVLVLNFVLASCVLALFQTYWTIAPYGCIIAVFLGLRDVATQLADPFGDDDVDFPVAHFVNYTVDSIVALLETFEGMNTTLLDEAIAQEKHFTDAQLTRAVDKKKLYKASGWRYIEEHHNWHSMAPITNKVDPQENYAETLHGVFSADEHEVGQYRGYMTQDDIINELEALTSERLKLQKKLEEARMKIKQLEEDGVKLPDPNADPEPTTEEMRARMRRASRNSRMEQHRNSMLKIDPSRPSKLQLADDPSRPSKLQLADQTLETNDETREQANSSLDEIAITMQDPKESQTQDDEAGGGAVNESLQDQRKDNTVTDFDTGFTSFTQAREVIRRRLALAGVHNFEDAVARHIDDAPEQTGTAAGQPYFNDPRPAVRGKCRIRAFHSAGYDDACDILCQVQFLSNFYEIESGLELEAPCAPGRKFVFRDAEAAFQATKFWHDANEFANLTGVAAAKETKRLMLRAVGNRSDETHAGFGSDWKAMRAILKAKFCAGSELCNKLVLTGDDYLLHVGRDKTWASHDGSGKNWLGLLLMVVRDDTLRRFHMAESWSSYFLDHDSGDPETHAASAWHLSVSLASDSLKNALQKMRRASTQLQVVPTVSQQHNEAMTNNRSGYRFQAFENARDDIKSILDTSLGHRSTRDPSTRVEI